VLRKLAATSPRLTELYREILTSIFTRPPFSLGYPSGTSQSTYYLGNITEEEIAVVSRVLEQNAIFPENTRIRKADEGVDFEVLLASVQKRGTLHTFSLPDVKGCVRLVQGDHSAELEQICAELAEANHYAANDLQRDALRAYVESFQTGSLDAYRESQRIWVRDKGPRVENIFGFVEPYRDPHGIRAEFEGLVAIADDDETRLLGRLVEHSAKFIRRLPWVTPENDGKGPFEKSLFEPPDFSSIHSK
jgi:dipeptidyl-peptidase-3